MPSLGLIGTRPPKELEQHSGHGSTNRLERMKASSVKGRSTRQVIGTVVMMVMVVWCEEALSYCIGCVCPCIHRWCAEKKLRAKKGGRDSIARYQGPSNSVVSLTLRTNRPDTQKTGLTRAQPKPHHLNTLLQSNEPARRSARLIWPLFHRHALMPSLFTTSTVRCV